MLTSHRGVLGKVQDNGWSDVDMGDGFLFDIFQKFIDRELLHDNRLESH